MAEAEALPRDVKSVPDANAKGALDDVPADLPVPSSAFDEMQFAAPPWSIAKASLGTDTPRKIKSYMQSFDQPETDFGVMDGNIVRRLRDNEGPEAIHGAGAFARVEPSVRGGQGFWDTAKRAGDWLASGVGTAIPMGAGAATALAGPETIPAAVALAGIGGGIGEFGRQQAYQALTGQPLMDGLDYGNIAGQTLLQGSGPVAGHLVAKGLAGATGLGGKALSLMEPEAGEGSPWGDLVQPVADYFKGMTTKNPFQLDSPSFKVLREKMTPDELTNIGQLRQESARSGVDLDMGQVTGLRSMQVRLRQALRDPATMDTLSDFRLGQQSKQVPAAFLNKVNELLPSGAQVSQEDAIGGFRKAANDVVQSTLAERGDLAKDTYAHALEEAPGKAIPDAAGKLVKVPQRMWSENLQRQLETPGGENGIANARKIWAQDPDRVGNELTVPEYEHGKIVGDAIAPNWRSWKYILQGMQQEYQGTLDQLGKTNPYGRNLLRTIQNIKSELWQANPALRHADALYGDASDAVNAVLDGGVGYLQGMKGMDRQQILDRMFGGKAMLAPEVARVRGMFENIGAGDQFESAANAWMRNHLNDALKPLRAGGEPGNVAGALYQSTYGQPEDKELMKAVLGDPEKVEKYARFMQVMKAASRYLPEASPTATDLPPVQSGVGKAIRATGDTLSPSNWLKLPGQLGNSIAELFDQKARTRVLNYLITPEGDAALAQMAKLKPSSIGAQRLLGQVLAGAAASGAGVRQATGQPPSEDGLTMIPKDEPLPDDLQTLPAGGR